MLKKRILASSLASVMALSSVSVVAFADETTTANYGEVVTRAELKEVVKGFKEFVDSELAEFGTTQSEQFMDAYNHAKTVSEDTDANGDDATAAYQMLISVRENMKQYTKEDLEALLDECQADYDTENKRDKNAPDDLIWDAGAFSTFEAAFADAERCVDFGTGRDITNLYVELKKAHDALPGKKLKTVNKTQFRAALKEYETLISNEKNYEPWRRGKFTVNSTTGDSKDEDDKKLELTKANTIVTFDEVLEIVTGASDDSVVLFVKDDGVTPRPLDTDKCWIKTDVANGVDVRDYINAASEAFEAYEKTNITSNQDIYAAYEVCLDAVKVFKGWKPDATNYAKAANITSLNKQYQKEFVKHYVTASAFFDDVAFKAAIGTDFKVMSKADIETATSSAYTVKNGYVVDASNDQPVVLTAKDGKFKLDSTGVKYEALGDAKLEFKLKPGDDLTKYIPVVSTLCGTTATNAEKDIKKMLELFEEMQAAEDDTDWETFDGNFKGADVLNANQTYDLDTNETIKTADGSSPVYTLIYRALYYAYMDELTPAAAADVYKLPDLRNLIEKAYELAEKVGDFAKFQTEYNLLVTSRQGAKEFEREATARARKDKDYKDGEDGVAFTLTKAINAGGTKTVAANTYVTGDGINTTKVYEALNEIYTDLDNAFKDYPISFGEIADKIAEISDGVESGVYGEKIATAVADVAFKLSTLKIDDEENQPFSEDRKLNKLGRLYVNEKASDDEKALYESYNALLKAVEEAGSTTGTKGDLTGDNKVNVMDATQLLKEIASGKEFTAEEIAVRDLNGDKNVNVLDAVEILKIIAKG